MEDLRVMCVVYVCKDTEELTVDVLDGRRESLGKVMACIALGKVFLSRLHRSHRILWGRHSHRRASFEPKS